MKFTAQKEIGRYLKRVRESSNIPIESVSVAAKYPRDYIEMLEETGEIVERKIWTIASAYIKNRKQLIEFLEAYMNFALETDDIKFTPSDIRKIQKGYFGQLKYNYKKKKLKKSFEQNEGVEKVKLPYTTTTNTYKPGKTFLIWAENTLSSALKTFGKCLIKLSKKIDSNTR